MKNFSKIALLTVLAFLTVSRGFTETQEDMALRLAREEAARKGWDGDQTGRMISPKERAEREAAAEKMAQEMEANEKLASSSTPEPVEEKEKISSPAAVVPNPKDEKKESSTAAVPEKSSKSWLRTKWESTALGKWISSKSTSETKKDDPKPTADPAPAEEKKVVDPATTMPVEPAGPVKIIPAEKPVTVTPTTDVVDEPTMTEAKKAELLSISPGLNKSSGAIATAMAGKTPIAAPPETKEKPVETTKSTPEPAVTEKIATDDADDQISPKEIEAATAELKAAPNPTLAAEESIMKYWDQKNSTDRRAEHKKRAIAAAAIATLAGGLIGITVFLPIVLRTMAKNMEAEEMAHLERLKAEARSAQAKLDSLGENATALDKLMVEQLGLDPERLYKDSQFYKARGKETQSPTLKKLFRMLNHDPKEFLAAIDVLRQREVAGLLTPRENEQLGIIKSLRPEDVEPLGFFGSIGRFFGFGPKSNQTLDKIKGSWQKQYSPDEIAKLKKKFQSPTSVEGEKKVEDPATKKTKSATETVVDPEKAKKPKTPEELAADLKERKKALLDSGYDEEKASKILSEEEIKKTQPVKSLEKPKTPKELVYEAAAKKQSLLDSGYSEQAIEEMRTQESEELALEKTKKEGEKKKGGLIDEVKNIDQIIIPEMKEKTMPAKATQPAITRKEEKKQPSKPNELIEDVDKIPVPALSSEKKETTVPATVPAKASTSPEPSNFSTKVLPPAPQPVVEPAPKAVVTEKNPPSTQDFVEGKTLAANAFKSISDVAKAVPSVPAPASTVVTPTPEIPDLVEEPKVAIPEKEKQKPDPSDPKASLSMAKQKIQNQNLNSSLPPLMTPDQEKAEEEMNAKLKQSQEAFKKAQEVIDSTPQKLTEIDARIDDVQKRLENAIDKKLSDDAKNLLEEEGRDLFKDRTAIQDLAEKAKQTQEKLIKERKEAKESLTQTEEEDKKKRDNKPAANNMQSKKREAINPNTEIKPKALVEAEDVVTNQNSVKSTKTPEQIAEEQAAKDFVTKEILENLAQLKKMDEEMENAKKEAAAEKKRLEEELTKAQREQEKLGGQIAAAEKIIAINDEIEKKKAELSDFTKDVESSINEVEKKYQDSKARRDELLKFLEAPQKQLDNIANEREEAISKLPGMKEIEDKINKIDKEIRNLSKKDLSNAAPEEQERLKEKITKLKADGTTEREKRNAKIKENRDTLLPFEEKYLLQQEAVRKFNGDQKTLDAYNELIEKNTPIQKDLNVLVKPKLNKLKEKMKKDAEEKKAKIEAEKLKGQKLDVEIAATEQKLSNIKQAKKEALQNQFQNTMKKQEEGKIEISDGLEHQELMDKTKERRARLQQRADTSFQAGVRPNDPFSVTTLSDFELLRAQERLQHQPPASTTLNDPQTTMPDQIASRRSMEPKNNPLGDLTQTPIPTSVSRTPGSFIVFGSNPKEVKEVTEKEKAALRERQKQLQTHKEPVSTPHGEPALTTPMLTSLRGHLEAEKEKMRQQNPSEPSSPRSQPSQVSFPSREKTAETQKAYLTEKNGQMETPSEGKKKKQQIH